MNEQETKYFATHWQMNWDNKKFSGWALLDKFKETDSILDIGCGTNPLKEKLGDKVYGIDPAFDQADEKITWDEYRPHREFNVFLCLGSLNFGTDHEIESQLHELKSHNETITKELEYCNDNLKDLKNENSNLSSTLEESLAELKSAKKKLRATQRMQKIGGGRGRAAI